MKKIILIAFFAIIGTGLSAQAPPPPPANAGSSGGPVGSPLSAPINGGLPVFIAFAAVLTLFEWKNITSCNIP